MFESFFPRPRLFFLSAIVWTIVSVIFWYTLGDDVGRFFGFRLPEAGAPPVIGLGYFVTPDFLWFYVYYLIITGIFAAFWFRFSPHRWQVWSVLGTALLLFNVYFGVQVSVSVNHWRRPFFDAIQEALTTPGSVTAADLYNYLLIFAMIAMLAVVIGVVTSFFADHYVFRWRNAMNDYYLERWEKLRKVEGASQRIQEDTRIFADIMQNLGVQIVDAIMTLVAFLPLLWALSEYVGEIPVFGEVTQALFWGALFWSVFGTFLMLFAGIKLPGLHFRNQRVEAAFRKELVYGEDDKERAEPMTVRELFGNVRRNYFRLYFHYLYFNVARNGFLQADVVFVFILLVPTFVVGAITLGIMQQILTAFGQVSTSFQFLVRSWTTIVELMSIHKRLKAFESVLHDKPLPELDEKFAKGDDTAY